jgi:hypothetical protein
MIGLALIVVGYIGYFFARLIQAAVSRSRESLADMSAVQFTRQSDGIAGALKKIALHSEGSALQAANKQEVAHMLFGEAGSFSALFATHPPLLQRIRALQPGFREEDLVQFAASVARTAGDNATTPQTAAAHPTGGTAAARSGFPGLGSLPPVLPVVLGGAIVAAQTTASASAPTALERGASLRRSLPAGLTAAVQQPEAALVAMLALAMSAQDELQQRQRRVLADALGDDVQQAVVARFAEVETLAPELRLPLAALAFPALKRLPAGRVQTLLDTLDALVRVDGQVDLDEYCLTRLLRVQLLEARRPRSAPVDGLRKLTACRASVGLVCAVLASHGSNDDVAARRAWLLAMQQVFPGETLNWPTLPVAWQTPFEDALDELDGLLPAAKELLLQGLVAAVHADGVVGVDEAGLLRVICASVHCPLPA